MAMKIWKKNIKLNNKKSSLKNQGLTLKKKNKYIYVNEMLIIVLLFLTVYTTYQFFKLHFFLLFKFQNGMQIWIPYLKYNG